MIYTTQPGDSLPSIAESYGHSGEWQAIVYFNGASLSDYNNIQPGTELVLPDEWNTDSEPKDTSSTTTKSTTTKSSTTSSSSA